MTNTLFMNFKQYNDLVLFEPLYRTGRATIQFIARTTSLSERHVRRVLKDLRPPQTRKSWNRIDEETRQFLIDAKQERPTYNCQWLAELASDRFEKKISQSTVWRVLKEASLLHHPQAEVTLRQRFETACTGDLVQMDTTWGYWLGTRRLYLILLLDDHSRCILHARFYLEETLWHNMTMVRETIEKHGKFQILYTDNASWFKAIRHNKSLYQTHTQKEYESDIGRACRELGVVHVTHKPYEPQGKGKVERIFRFIQERFVSELDDTELPLWLINKKFAEWVVWYNQRHVNRTTGQTPQKRFDAKAFKPLSITERRKLDDIFCIRETRTVDKCNQFHFEGHAYTIPSSTSLTHRKVSLNVLPRKKIRVWLETRFICELNMI